MDNIKFLTDLNIQEIVSFIVDDENIEYDEAIDRFYSSAVFKKLSDPLTGLYRESPAYIYELFKNELKHGKIIQNEQ